MKWDSNFSFFCLNLTAETMCCCPRRYAFGALFPLLFHVAWVVVENLFAQGGRVDMRIDFGCSNVFMTEHRLNGAQVGSAFQKGRSKRVTERVRGDGFRDSGLQGLAFDHNQNHCSSEM